MQAIKDKLSDISAVRHAKAEAKEEEKVDIEQAKTRVEVAHEVRLAREAKAAMDLHVNKAVEKVAREEAKHSKDHAVYQMHGGETTGLPAYGGSDMDYYAGNNAQNTSSTMTNFSERTGYMGNAPRNR